MPKPFYSNRNSTGISTSGQLPGKRQSLITHYGRDGIVFLRVENNNAGENPDSPGISVMGSVRADNQNDTSRNVRTRPRVHSGLNNLS